MCLSIPGKVISIDGDNAKVSVSGVIIDASLQLLDDIKMDDYVLVHTGFAIQKMDEEAALETIETFKEFSNLLDGIDEES